MPEVGVDPLLRNEFESYWLRSFVLGSINDNIVDTPLFGGYPVIVDKSVAITKYLAFEDDIIGDSEY